MRWEDRARFWARGFLLIEVVFVTCHLISYNLKGVA